MLLAVLAVDKLLRLHQPQRLDLVAEFGGGFELQGIGGLLHFVVQGGGEFVGFAA